LAAALAGNIARDSINLGDAVDSCWLGRAMRALEQLARKIGGECRALQQWPSLGDVYRTFTLKLPPQPSFRERSAVIGVRLGLQDIVVDLCLMGMGILGKQKIVDQDVHSAHASPLWSMEAWLEAFCDRSIPLHSTSGAEALLELVASNLGNRDVDFRDRADITIKTSHFALEHGLHDWCRDELRKAADCLMGYGSHKDLFVFEVIAAVRLLSVKGDQKARETFLSLSKEIEAITEYTDGDETTHARSEFHQGIAELFPENVPALIAAQEWYRAEDVIKAWTKEIPTDSEAGQLLWQHSFRPRNSTRRGRLRTQRTIKCGFEKHSGG